MNVNKINENLLRITLTEEELYFDYDLEIKDLTDSNNREEVSKTLVNIVINAAQGYNMEMNNGLHLEIHLSPSNEIILDAYFNAEFNLNNLSGIAKFFKSLLFKMPKEQADEIINNTISKMGLSKDQLEQIFDIMDKLDIVPPQEENIYSENYLYIIEINNLDIAINVSKLLKNVITDSVLYKYDKKYYLELYIKPDTDEYVINIFTEFLLKRKDDLYISFVKEHGETIIKKDAVNVLSSI